MSEASTWLLAAIAIYFLPWIVAHMRDHKNVGAIIVVNIFLGWTLIGWVWALAWSFTANVQTKESAPPTPDTHVKCPDCAELIKREARICKHCGCKLVPQ